MPDYEARYRGIDLRTIDPFIERSNDLQELDHIDGLLLHDIDRISLRLELAEKRKASDGEPIDKNWEYRTRLVLKYFHRSRHKITARKNAIREIERKQKQKHFEEVFIELVKHRYPAEAFKTLVRDASELADTGGLAHVQADIDWLEAAGFECVEYDESGRTATYRINVGGLFNIDVRGNFEQGETTLILRDGKTGNCLLDSPTRQEVWNIAYALTGQLAAEPNQNV